MSKLSNLFRQEVSCQASKIAADVIRAQKSRATAYILGGKIFVGCGMGWISMSLIPVAYKSSMNDYV